MSHLFPSLPDPAGLGDVFRQYPETVPPLLDFHDRLLRGDSPLSVAERELIAAYVSALNACQFCHGAHLLYARAFGISEAALDAMVTDLDAAPLEDRQKPLLAYVAKLTRDPTSLRRADAEAVYAAGWTERALYDAVQVCALFNFMNRIVEGTGVAAYPLDPDSATEEDLAARRGRSYADFGRELGILPPQGS
ncbi:peroxidase [Rhodobacteraceae bacterium W635]|uniref:carboxymuconolactone decarboxylase family protein n=1 Tax=Nioella halotolerans TaxID=2303578 RepID=UPI000E3DC41C|nr:peroxidase [Rhodobacteraceae bacterium W635]